MKTILVFSVIISSCLAQRPYYAGSSGLGYSFVDLKAVDMESTTVRSSTTSTVRLPLEALGDANLVQRLSKAPVDQQPFWLVNWKALDDNRKNPQSYAQKGNSYTDYHRHFPSEINW